MPVRRSATVLPSTKRDCQVVATFPFGVEECVVTTTSVLRPA